MKRSRDSDSTSDVSDRRDRRGRSRSRSRRSSRSYRTKQRKQSSCRDKRSRSRSRKFRRIDSYSPRGIYCRMCFSHEHSAERCPEYQRPGQKDVRHDLEDEFKWLNKARGYIHREDLSRFIWKAEVVFYRRFDIADNFHRGKFNGEHLQAQKFTIRDIEEIAARCSRYVSDVIYDCILIPARKKLESYKL